MRTGLIHHEIYPKFPDQISTFLVNTLLMTTDIVMDHQERKALIREFSNPELCDITENLVFGEPMLDYNGRNDIFPPVREFVEKEIYGDDALKTAVARLKFRFMNEAQSLIHGDLHTGSVFINQEHTFVFDPEFAFFGPMGYDIGNVIANLFFAWANGNATIDAPAEKARFCGWCMRVIVEIIDLFKEKFCRLYDEQVTEPLAKSEDFKAAYLRDILADTAGYVGTECIRRIVGMAHNKDMTVIENAEKRATAEKILLTFAKDLILHQKEFQRGADYYRAMEDAVRAIEPDNPLIGRRKRFLIMTPWRWTTKNTLSSSSTRPGFLPHRDSFSHCAKGHLGRHLSAESARRSGHRRRRRHRYISCRQRDFSFDGETKRRFRRTRRCRTADCFCGTARN